MNGTKIGNKNNVRPFPIYKIEYIFKYSDYLTTLRSLKLNKRLANEVKKTNIYKILYLLNIELNKNTSNLSLNYILFNNAAIMCDIVMNILSNFNNKEDFFDIIYLFIGKWIYRKYLSFIYRDKELIQENGEIIRITKKPNIKMCNLLLMTEGSKYFFSSLIYLNDNMIKYIDLSNNYIKGTEFIHKMCLSKKYFFKLQTLNISNNQINDDTLRNFLLFFENVKLENLILSNNKITSKGCKSLSDFFHKTETLLHIDLSFNLLDLEAAKYLSDLISNLNKFVEINFEGNNIAMEGTKLIMDGLMLNKNLNLQVLNVSNTRFGVDGAKFLSNFLKEVHCRISNLNLSENKIEGLGSKYICSSLLHNKYLKELNLKGNAINSFDKLGVNSLSELIIINKVIENLNLSSNSFDDKSIYFISNSIRMNNTLKILVLDNNRMQDKGSIYLAESFKYNHSIKELSVRNNINFSLKPFILDVLNFNSHAYNQNSISSNMNLPLSIKFSKLVKVDLSNNLFNCDDIKHICNLIAENTYFLKDLNLSENKIGAEGAQHLAELFTSKNIIIESLILSNNDLESEGALFIKNIIQSSKFLRILKLDSNHLGWVGVEMLLEGFKYNTISNLNHLNLKRNFISDKGIYFINNLIKNDEVYSNQIKEIDLSSNGITDEGLRSLSQALNSNFTLEKIILKDNHLGQKSAVYLLDNLDASDTFDRIELDYEVNK